MRYPKPYMRGATYSFLYTLNGKRYHKSTGKTRLRDAQRFIRDFMDDIERGTTNVTLGYMLEQFSDVKTNPKYQEAQTLSGHYGKVHASHVAITSKHCIDILEGTSYYNKQLRLFNKSDVKNIAQMIVLAHGHCEKSVKMFKHIKLVFNYADDQDYIPFSPARRVSDIRYKPEQKQKAISSKLLVETFTNHDKMPNEMAFQLFNLIAFTGLRRGEALALKWKNVDLEQGIITVERSVKENGEIGLPKWEKCRVIPICTHLTENLKQYRTTHKQECLFEKRGKIISMQTYTNWFKQIAKDNDLGITGHGLRHSLHTQLRARGCPDSLLQDYMSWGSQNQSDIQDRYTDYMVEDLRKVSEMIDELIQNP